LKNGAEALLSQAWRQNLEIATKLVIMNILYCLNQRNIKMNRTQQYTVSTSQETKKIPVFSITEFFFDGKTQVESGFYSIAMPIAKHDKRVLWRY